MANLLMERAKEDDAKFIAARMTERDRESVEAQYAGAATDLLVDSIRRSRPGAVLFTTPLEPLALVGVVPDRVIPNIGLAGIIWCAATAYARKRFRKEFERFGKGISDANLEHYDVLHNVEDARNEEDIAWLRRCGFRVIGKLPEYGPKKLPFIHFAKFKKEMLCPLSAPSAPEAPALAR